MYRKILDETHSGMPMTEDSLIAFLVSLAGLPSEQLPVAPLRLARQSLFDWLICGLAGQDEPAGQAIRKYAGSESGSRPCGSLFGGGMASARLAALANGTITHALDYDDTHFDHVGHLSVGIFPAILAMAEQEDLSVAEMSSAFLIGAEGAIRLGMVLGVDHYNRGFHQTATAGAFGATMAAGRIAGLDAEAQRRALGLCATLASGLKSQFGTMGKPLNAGLSAANGIEAVRLAQLGFSTARDGLFGPQGFVETHTDNPDLSALRSDVTDLSDLPFRFLSNRYKFHACCHGLHAMIEGLLELRSQHPLTADDVARLELRTAPRWLRVCDVKRPTTGLEVKFSYGWLAGMVMSGRATGDDRTYTDALAADPDLADFAARVEVLSDASVGDQQAEGTVFLRDGRALPFQHDLAHPIPAEALRDRLRQKARTVLRDGASPLLELADSLYDAPESVSARQLGALIRRPS